MQRKLHISRYNKTRNWAVWANEELLAVTVYRKGAQAVLDYIHNIIITNPTTQHTTMAKTKSVNTAAATTTAADFDSTIIKAVNGEGKTIRIKFDPLGVSVCYNLKGKWCAHEIYNQPLPELIAEGVFTIEDEDSQKTYAKYFNAGKKNKRSKAKKSKKQKKNAEPQKQEQEAAIAAIEEAPHMEASEINEEVEASLWQEIEEAREAEQQAEATMEAQDEESAEADEESAEPAAEEPATYEPESNEPEINEPVTDVEPTAEALAQESAAEAAQPEEAPRKLSTYNLKKAGQAPVSLSPQSKDIKLEPGDQLIRIYKGSLIEVEVTENGYRWNGEVYPTLTHISWKAAGYQIGGNNFFGLPSKPRNKA
ncbi:MAG: DUF2924 domain-containing protein [Akkermansia sp.]|nr:DUF2924 domain-containing protein [Akkermansia sp.]